MEEKVLYEVLPSTKRSYVEARDHVFKAPHNYVVKATEDDKVLGEVNFQRGAIDVAGLNGVTNEDLINMVINRLEHFQKSEFSCKENACALTHFQEGLMWLEKRTQKRSIRGVEGTHNV